MRRLPPAIIAAIVLVAGFAICAMQFPHIASTRVVANLLTDNAFLGIVATGMTFVILSGGIGLSVGSVVSDFALRLPGGGRLTAIALIMLVAVMAGALTLQLTRFGANLFAFVALQQGMIAIARRSAVSTAGATP